MEGVEPSTFPVSGGRSNQMSYMSLGQSGRVSNLLPLRHLALSQRRDHAWHVRATGPRSDPSVRTAVAIHATPVDEVVRRSVGFGLFLRPREVHGAVDRAGDDGVVGVHVDNYTLHEHRCTP